MKTVYQIIFFLFITIFVLCETGCISGGGSGSTESPPASGDDKTPVSSAPGNTDETDIPNNEAAAEYVSPTENGNIEFLASLSSPVIENSVVSRSITKSQSAGEPAAIVISLKNNDDATVLDSLRMNLYKFDNNGGYATDSVEIPAGTYQLTKYWVLDAFNNVIKATPIKDTIIGDQIETPLPMQIVVEPDSNRFVTSFSPVTVDIGDIHPSYFGYNSFTYEIIEEIILQLAIAICEASTDKFKLTNAGLKIVTGDEVLFNEEIGSSFKNIPLKNTDGQYTISVTKSGNECWKETFSNIQLMIHKLLPLIITICDQDYSISGNVAENGEGLIYVPINLEGDEISSTTKTDSTGNYTFSNLKWGQYSITPSIVPSFEGSLIGTQASASVMRENNQKMPNTTATISESDIEFFFNHYSSPETNVNVSIDLDSDSIDIIYENTGRLSLSDGSNSIFTFVLPDIPVYDLELVENNLGLPSQLGSHTEWSVDPETGTITIEIFGIWIGAYSTKNVLYRLNSNPMPEDAIFAPSEENVSLLFLKDVEDINFEVTTGCQEPEVIEIDSCGVLDKNCATYKLTKDISTEENGHCFDITADNVTLDGDGHTITGPQVHHFTDIGLYAFSVSGIAVKNCTITDFNQAIELKCVKQSTINNNTLTNNSNQGVYLLDSRNNLIESNYAEGNWIGFYCSDGATDNVLTKNEAYSNKFGYSFRGDNNILSENIGCGNVVNNIQSDVSCYPAEGITGENNQFNVTRDCPDLSYSLCDTIQQNCGTDNECEDGYNCIEGECVPNPNGGCSASEEGQ